MIWKVSQLLSGDSSSLPVEKQKPTGSTYRDSLIRRLRKSRETRARWAESNLDKTIAFQIRALRADGGWTQAEFAKELGITHPNNVSARLENPEYGKHTLTTLKKVAATCDVALVVWFVPYSRLIDWESGTPYTDNGLTPAFYDISPFDEDEGLSRGKKAEFDLSKAGLGFERKQLDDDVFGAAHFPKPQGDADRMEIPYV